MTSALPETMTFIDLPSFGGPEALVPATGPLPKPGPEEVLVKVAAAGVNRPDVMQRQGNYNPPPGASPVPGLEIAGEVVALGAGVADLKTGDRVCALVGGGGYAEYCAAPGPQCLPVPEGLSLLEAAALPETYFTVWTNVFERGRLKAGETLLVHGGSSGIGTTAIQLARQFGARVFTTVGNAEKARACEALGAERAINYREEDYVAVVKELTGGAGVDLILDMVGGDYLPRDVEALAVEGRLVQIAFQKPSRIEFDFLPMMLKRLTLTGSTLRPRTVEQKAAIARQLREKVWPLLAAGAVRPVIFETFPLREAAKAHALMDSSRHIGKIMLDCG
ncbi:MAG: NAD(P)H-quinone oxidoreductase [Tistlia sp.]|uniref:NAD(P)H-quinone oxidoreductase n=1 Tax=Tistlia sp. TaxID=3057121 RepID=UPI0034A3D2AE